MQRVTLSLLSILASALCPLSAAPKYVLIISYAEFDESFNLNVKGQERALALPYYFTGTLSPLYGIPNAIFGPRESVLTSSGMRIIETITPTSRLLREPLHLGFAQEDPVSLANFILKSPLYEGQTVLIIWDFATIPDLIGAFGYFPPLLPSPPEYDLTYVLDFPYTFPAFPVVLLQALLFGDNP